MKLNQPKFIIPLIVAPFIFIFNYFLLTFQKSEENSLETKKELNTNLSNPSEKSLIIKNKMEGVQDEYKDIIDISAIDSDVEEGVNTNVKESIYTKSERDSILKYQDSISKLRDFFKNKNPFNVSKSDNSENFEKDAELRKLKEERMLLEQKRKLQEKILDSLLNPQKYTSVKVIKDSIKKEVEKTFEVKKVTDPNNNFFNTVNDANSSNSNHIKALLDEKITVTQGSRVRIKTNTDMTVNRIKIPKYSYVYGNVTGFSPERVLISIKNILINGKIYKVNLDVYDLDGMKGLYIRNSKFVEFSKELGSNSIERAGSGLERNQQQGGEQSIIGDVIREVTKATAQTTAKLISKNKAHLKYNTNIYLINSKTLQ